MAKINLLAIAPPNHYTLRNLAQLRDFCDLSVSNDVRELVRLAPAAEIILLGSPFNATRAMELGFVSHVVPDDKLLTTATETARKLAAKSSAALRAAKRLMKRPFLEDLRSAIQAENAEFSIRVRSEDAKEALTAFLEKRPPNFNRASTSPEAG